MKYLSNGPVLRSIVFLIILLAGVGAAAAVQVTGVLVDARKADTLTASASGESVGSEDRFDSIDYLAAADRLTLRFRGYPELTGDYRVSPDHVISIPVIGRVSITGMDLAALEKILSTKLSQVVQKEAFVTVEVAAYRPVFVTGAVKNPGAVEWRPDLTVLQAIALVGGMAADTVPGAIPGTGTNPLALHKAIDGQKRDLATIARLLAERQDAPHITIPPQLISLVGLSEANVLISHETEIMVNDRGSINAKRATLQQGIAAANTEMTSLRTQIDKLNFQLKLRVDYQGKIQGLFSKGIITAERNLEEEIKVTDLEEKITNIGVGLAKSAGTVAELQLADVTLQRDRQSAIDAELARLERDSSQLALEISAGRLNPEALPQRVSDRPEDTATLLLQIVRQRKGSSSTIAADQGSLMLPGDVLVVGRS